MSESVSNIGIFLFWFDWNIVFISFAVIIVVGYRSIESFFLPFDDVFEGRTLVPNSVGDEAVFV